MHHHAALTGLQPPTRCHGSGIMGLPARLQLQRARTCRVQRQQQLQGGRLAGGRPPSQPVVLASAASAAASSSGQQQQDPIGSVPMWAKLLGAAAACAAWYSVACAMKATAPFLSLTMVAGTSSEGLRSAVRSAWAGLAAGCLHTLAGADHLAALTPLTIGRSHFKASLMGALWGFGHSTGQLILGLLMVVLKDRFQQLVPALSKWGGTTVGLTLLAIGVLGIYESFFEEHHEDDHHHSGSSSGDEGAADFTVQDGVLVAKQKASRKGLLGLLATYATGIIYGLQPDALFVIIPALALPTKVAAVAYIFCFVAGTCSAMGGYTFAISATSAAIKKSNSGLTKKLSGAAAFAAIAIGLVIISGGSVSLPFVGGH